MPETIIRLAGTADVISIERIIWGAYTKYVERLGKPPGPMIDDCRSHVRLGSPWILDYSDIVVGILVLQSNPRSPARRQCGRRTRPSRPRFGRQLLSFAEVAARRRGHDQLRLDTNIEMHENIATYERYGWNEYTRGEQAGYQHVFMRKAVGEHRP